MTDAVITEYEGTRRNDTITRVYHYGSGGVRVLDSNKNIRRLYRFDPSSDMMTECDPSRPDKVMRRFIFDRMGMLEETFSQGCPPRTFRYEKGGRQIAVREGGEFGQVGKIITFEDEGISETGWGRHGEIERVFVFERGNDTITERSGGWFGDVARTIIFSGINASLFREPEAFLQFLMFSEWSAADREAQINERVADIRGNRKVSRQTGRPAPSRQRPSGSQPRNGLRPADSGSTLKDDWDIEFIPEGDAPVKARAPLERRSDSISFSERMNRNADGRSTGIPVRERFDGARREQEPLSRGHSAEIPLSERFENARKDKEQPMSPGRSVEIPLEERFESARSTRQKPSRGRSAEIPYSERRGEEQ